MKKSCSIFLFFGLICTICFHASAKETESRPLWRSVFLATADFDINSQTGRSVVSISYFCPLQSIKHVDIFVKIDKKSGDTLTRITHWNERSTLSSYSVNYGETLTDHGVYLATAEFTVTYSNDKTETFTEKQEKIYS